MCVRANTFLCSFVPFSTAYFDLWNTWTTARQVVLNQLCTHCAACFCLKWPDSSVVTNNYHRYNCYWKLVLWVETCALSPHECIHAIRLSGLRESVHSPDCKHNDCSVLCVVARVRLFLFLNAPKLCSLVRGALRYVQSLCRWAEISVMRRPRLGCGNNKALLSQAL